MPETAYLPRSATRPMTPRPFKVVSTRDETHDVATIMLEPDDGRSCFMFEPAQIVMIGVPGVGEVPISISSHPDGSRCIGVTIRRAGAVTNSILDTPVGEVLSIRGPYGSTWPMESAYGGETLFIAGGLGLAPLRSAILAVTDDLDPSTRAVLLYGAKTPGDLLFPSDLEIWIEQDPISVLTTVDHGDDAWDGRVGLVTEYLDEALGLLDDPVTMLCGPDVMIRIVCGALIDRGRPADSIWVTLERNMKCGIGLCGHCQFGPYFLCKDGPVLRYDRVMDFFDIPEV